MEDGRQKQRGKSKNALPRFPHIVPPLTVQISREVTTWLNSLVRQALAQNTILVLVNSCDRGLQVFLEL
jgi:hypothetical protein